jgi:hypothetical protein
MSSAIDESLVIVDMLGGGALETVLILGRRTRPSREYQRPGGVVGGVGSVCSSTRLSCRCCVCCRSISPVPSSLLLADSGAWVLVGEATPVSSVNSCSFEKRPLGVSVTSSSSSLKMDFRRSVVLWFDMEKEEKSSCCPSLDCLRICGMNGA